MVSSHRSRIQQRWVDLDAQAHVNNARVLDYLQEARVDWLLSGPHAGLLGRAVVVVEHQVSYLAGMDIAAGFVEVDLSLGHVGASRFALGYEVRQRQQVAAVAATQMCYVSPETGRAAPMPPDTRAWFAAQSGELEPLPDLGSWVVGAAAHEHSLRVRWSDIDAYGHVNNVTYYDYVAEARIALTAAVMPDSIVADVDSRSAHRWLVARQDIRYVREVRHRREPYLVRTAFFGVGRTSVRLVAEIVDPVSGVVFARTRTVLVHADATGAPSPVPDSLRSAVERWPAIPRDRGRP